MHTLTTDRLTLRTLTKHDVDQLIAAINDKRVYDTTVLIPHPYTEADARDWLRIQHEIWDAGGAAFGVFTNDPPLLVGGATLSVDRQHDRAELGYWIGADHWGEGYATEAARALIDFGFETLDLERIWAGHFGVNEASGRVQRKIGLRYEGVLRRQFRKDGVYHDDVVHAILRDEWEAGRASKSRFLALTTDRLVLRAPSLDDIDDFLELYRHKQVADGVLTVPHPFTREHALTRLRKAVASNLTNNNLIWAITRYASDAVIGDCGAHIDPDHNRAVLGYALHPDHWNEGYITEALEAVLQYLFIDRIPALHRVSADHYADNPASGRVCEKLGMHREGTLRGFLKKDGEQRDVVRWAILRDDWLKSR